METLQHIPLNTPGAGGLDRRSDVADVEALFAAELVNLDLWPAGDGPQGARVLPRRWFRRHGQWAPLLTHSLQAGPGITGTYQYQYVWTDGGGLTHYSRPITGVAPSNEKVRVTGWPTSAGTVAIYRTVASGSTLKLVVSGLNVTTNSFYDDSVADGSLGANLGTVPAHVDPVGNDAFNQTALCDFLLAHKSQNEATRLLSGFARNDGHNSLPDYFYNLIDSDEYLREAGIGFSTIQTEPHSAALLGDKLWVATPDGLYYRYGAADSDALKAASQPSQPSITSVTPGGGGAITVNTGWIYVVQDENLYTGLRSLPSASKNTGAFAAKLNVVVAFAAVPSQHRRHIYRTSDGGSQYQFVNTAAAGATSYTDTTLDEGLSQQTVPWEVGAAGKFKFLAAHKGILFAARDISSTTPSSSKVRWSNSLYPFNFPNDPTIAPDYEFEIDPDDGDEIAGLYSWGEVLIVFKRRRVYLLSGDPPTGFRWSPLLGSRGLGCVGFRTIQETPAGLAWLSPAGICLMSAPGAAPVVISERVRDLLIEPMRAAAALAGSTLTEEPADIQFDYQPASAAAVTANVRVQLDDNSDFSSVTFDYDTTDAAERPYFLANNAAYPAAGVTVQPGQRLRVAVRPPEPGGGGPVAGTPYYVRWAVNTGGGWGDWTVLAATFKRAADDPYADAPQSDTLPWAFAVHYAPREEYWLFVPTGGRRWCDTALVLNYGRLLRGGEPAFRTVRVAATAGTVVESVVVNAQAARDYLILAGADGLLWVYPWVDDGYDCDTRVTVAAGQRRVSATLSGGVTLTASGTTWDTTRYKLKGNVVVARDAATGLTYTGLITNNTGTTLTVAWLEGRTPPNGALDIVIGGLDAFVQTPWIGLAEDPAFTAVLREILLHTTSFRAQLKVVTRAAKEARRRLSEARVTRLLTVPVGRGFEQLRKPVTARGHVHCLRFGSIEDGQLWELQSCELVVEPTGSRI